MSWWKKIINAVPLIFAGYELGQSVEQKTNQELIETIHSNKEQHAEEPINKVEIILLALTVSVIIFYIVKKIKKAFKRSLGQVRQI